MKPNVERLRTLLRVMHGADPKYFSMVRFTHKCGTPACLAGHAMAHWRKDLDYVDARMKFFRIDLATDQLLFWEKDKDGHRRDTDTVGEACSRIVDVIEAHT